MKTVWVLTRSINEYNQEGEYFEGVWADKPTIEQLVSFFKGDNMNAYYSNITAALDFFLHLQNGGGRRGHEDEWYELSEVDLL